MLHPPLNLHYHNLDNLKKKMPPPQKHKKISQNQNLPNLNSSSSSTPFCKHSPSATLDILILILVLFSCSFLIFSYFSYIFHSLSKILPSLLIAQSISFNKFPLFYILGFLTFFTVLIVTIEIWFSYKSRKCDRPGCKGLKKALEFDIQLQTEDCLKKLEVGPVSVKDSVMDNLPWKGGTADNPDYECLRSELRKMAPPNGRAILLFRAKCGCPIAKLEAWGAKRGRRHKKALSNLVLKGGGDKR